MMLCFEAWATDITSDQTRQVRYLESSAVITNPERGFYHQISCNTPISPSTFASYYGQGNALNLCYFNLGAYLTSPIAQSALDAFQQQMDNMRTAGVKTVIRFAYNQSGSNADAALPQMTAHMDQLAPYLEKNKDVIAAVQGGFIGSYGEGDYSANYGYTGALSAQNWADRKTVHNKQLQTTPVERMVLLHMPQEKMTFQGSSPVSASEAFNGSGRARVGHHNDCFLSTPTDMGTYTNLSTEHPYLQADTLYTAMGGETCKLNPPRTDCPTVLKELGMFHWSFLHQNYNVDVLNSWKNQGCYTEVQKRLGYRFALKDGTYSMSARPGGGFAVRFNLVNQGWAAPFNSRNVEIVLRNNATCALFRSKLNADPRRWLPGQAVTIEQTVTLPASMPSGNYSLLLNLPDPMSSIAGRPQYAIQLANDNVWESSTGFNKLNHTVNVSRELTNKRLRKRQ